MSVLESAVAALRDGAPSSDARADATRKRLVRSLERRAHRRRQAITLVTVLGVMLGATASWAWTTGRLESLFGSASSVTREQPGAPATEPAPHRKPAVSAQAPREPAAAPALAPPILQAAPQPDAWPEPTEAAPPAPPPPVAKRSRPAEVLYRRAHELHFHGADRAAALAAWDAYLAAESTGRFAIEARFNRGLVLVRLARYAEAIEALAPFARGEVAGGYRHDEAAELVTRLRALVETP